MSVVVQILFSFRKNPFLVPFCISSIMTTNKWELTRSDFVLMAAKSARRRYRVSLFILSLILLGILKIASIWLAVYSMPDSTRMKEQAELALNLSNIFRQKTFQGSSLYNIFRLVGGPGSNGPFFGGHFFHCRNKNFRVF